MNRASDIPLIVIVGQTASGKTALALELAERFNGEIICADSRTIYRGMDIGTAKPTKEEQTRVPHHCIDCIEPDEAFSAAQFKQSACTAIEAIGRRDRIPIMVGGTGLYIDAVLFDYQFGDYSDGSLRAELTAKSVDELQEIILRKRYTMPENKQNKRYLIRTIERHGDPGGRSGLRPHTLVIGLRVHPDLLKQRIAERVDRMIEEGFVEEYKKLRNHFASDAPGFLAPGYKAFAGYLDGTLSFDEAKTLFVHNDWHLAKRQRTWFQRNSSIQWIDERSKVVDLATTFLNN